MTESQLCQLCLIDCFMTWKYKMQQLASGSACADIENVCSCASRVKKYAKEASAVTHLSGKWLVDPVEVLRQAVQQCD